MTEQEQLLNMNTTTSPGTAPLFQEVLNRHVLMRAKPNLVHHQFGQKVKVPKGKTKTISFDKMSPLPKAKNALDRRRNPEGEQREYHTRNRNAEAVRRICDIYG